MQSTLNLSEKKDQSLQILALSLDADGCVFNHSYCDSDSENRLIECNQLLIQHILNQIDELSINKVIFLNHSLRQNADIDRGNAVANHTESWFAAIRKLCDHIQPLRPHVPCEVNHARMPYWDEGKVSYAYLHMHTVASENPTATIYHQFFDDKAGYATERGIGILSAISAFYDEHPLLMPKNVKQQLFHYIGTDLKKFVGEENHGFPIEIQGTGIIDPFHKENIRFFAECFDCTSFYDDGPSSKLHWVGRIEKFITERKISVENLCKELKYEIKYLTGFKKNFYNTLNYNTFQTLLLNVQKELYAEIKKKQGRHISEDEIFHSDEMIIVNDLLRMIRIFRKENIEHGHYFNTDRKTELQQFCHLYGKPTSFTGLAKKTLSHSTYHLFFSPNNIEIQLQQIASMLENFMLEDHLEENIYNEINYLRVR